MAHPVPTSKATPAVVAAPTPAPASDASKREELVSLLYKDIVTKNAFKGHLTDFTQQQLDEFIGPSPRSALSGMTLSLDTKADWQVAVCSAPPATGHAPYKWGELELRAAEEVIPEKELARMTAPRQAMPWRK